MKNIDGFTETVIEIILQFTFELESVAAGECVEGWGSLKWAAGLSGGEKGAAEMSRLM